MFVNVLLDGQDLSVKSILMTVYQTLARTMEHAQLVSC